MDLYLWLMGQQIGKIQTIEFPRTQEFLTKFNIQHMLVILIGRKIII